MKAYLEMRDGPFQPEPMGPRSAKGRAQRAKDASFVVNPGLPAPTFNTE